LNNEQFSPGAHDTLARAQRQAMSFSHKQVEPIHVLRAILVEQDNLVAIILDKVNEDSGKTYTIEEMNTLSKTFLENTKVVQYEGRPEMSEVMNQLLVIAIGLEKTNKVENNSANQNTCFEHFSV